MLVLFTDYGWHDPYVGQVKGVLARFAPGVPLIDLLHAVPDFNAHAGAQLLDALSAQFPIGAVFMCVVDPGVGSHRDAAVLEADGRWFVGPDNGLLSIVAARALKTRAWHIHWRPDIVSDTFHGRDLFAPVAARLATGDFPSEWLTPLDALNIQFDASELPRILYIDHYGNAWTGIRGGLAEPTATKIEVHGKTLPWRKVFSDAAKSEPFWFVNSAGLVEIAANRDNAAQLLGLAVGDVVKLSGSLDSRLH
jgi:S-adenosyl-L-methionine hydrolase (adenosine-forming)